MDKDDDARISAALARGRVAVEGLGPATDGLTETIAQIERVLAEYRFGVEAETTLISPPPPFDDEAPEPDVSLAFRKQGKVWRLLVETEVDRDVRASALLINASREIRKLAIDKLPELIERLVARAEAELAEVESRRAQAQTVLATLKSTRPTKAKAEP